MVEEQWLPVVGYEDLYEVSDQGRVRSIPRTFTRIQNGRPATVTVRGKIQSLQRSKQGRLHLLLQRLGDHPQHKNVMVHHLMLEAFIGPRPPGMVGCHTNDVGDDNRLENLRWDTPSANRLDSVRNGTHSNARKTHCKRGHEFTPENTIITPDRRRNCRECERLRRPKYESTEESRARQREAQRRYREAHPRILKPKVTPTHCKYGHEFTPENTYVAQGRRYCRECVLRRTSEYRARRRQKAGADA
jgi:hypothetical protein